MLRTECMALQDCAWIVIDEVRHLMAQKRQRFVLSGSSARKLRRSGANLLAVRAEMAFLEQLWSGDLIA